MFGFKTVDHLNGYSVGERRKHFPTILYCKDNSFENSTAQSGNDQAKGNDYLSLMTSVFF